MVKEINNSGNLLKKEILTGYNSVLKDVVNLINEARRISARSVNTIMTATYWGIGRRIVEFEQGG